MNQEFRQCLESKKIVSFARGKKLVRKELSVARSDLSDAKAGCGNERYKWSTIRAIMQCFMLPGLLSTPGVTVKRATTVWLWR